MAYLTFHICIGVTDVIQMLSVLFDSWGIVFIAYRRFIYGNLALYLKSIRPPILSRATMQVLYMKMLVTLL